MSNTFHPYIHYTSITYPSRSITHFTPQQGHHLTSLVKYMERNCFLICSINYWKKWENGGLINGSFMGFYEILWDVSSGKVRVCYGKSHFTIGKSTIDGPFFNSELSNDQRVPPSHFSDFAVENCP